MTGSPAALPSQPRHRALARRPHPGQACQGAGTTGCTVTAAAGTAVRRFHSGSHPEPPQPTGRTRWLARPRACAAWSRGMHAARSSSRWHKTGGAPGISGRPRASFCGRCLTRLGRGARAGGLPRGCPHRVLVPKYQEFGVLGHLTPGQHHQTTEQTANEQVDARKDHLAMIPTRLAAQARSSNRAPQASQPSPHQPRRRNGQVNDVIEFPGGAAGPPRSAQGSSRHDSTKNRVTAEETSAYLAKYY
jgi:hypothetical protein